MFFQLRLTSCEIVGACTSETQALCVMHEESATFSFSLSRGIKVIEGEQKKLQSQTS